MYVGLCQLGLCFLVNCKMFLIASTFFFPNSFDVSNNVDLSKTRSYTLVHFSPSQLSEGKISHQIAKLFTQGHLNC